MSPKSKPEDFVEISSGEMTIDETRKILFRVSKNVKNDKMYLDVRQFDTKERYTGFTKKGINIPFEMSLIFQKNVEDVIASVPSR